MRQHNTNSYLDKYKKQQEIEKSIKELKEDERRLIQSYTALTTDQKEELEEVWAEIIDLDKQYSELQEEMNELVEKGVFINQINEAIELGIV